MATVVGRDVMARKKKTKKDFNRGLGPRVDAIQVWCDGSASPNPGPSSVGVIIIRDGVRFPAMLNLGHGTNNAAELKAIEVGLSLLVEEPYRAVDVYSDSQYAIRSVTGRHRVTANAELVAQIQAIMKRFGDLRFIWVPGHSGVGLNHEVDRLALRARELGHQGPR